MTTLKPEYESPQRRLRYGDFFTRIYFDNHELNEFRHFFGIGSFKNTGKAEVNI